MTTPPTEPRKPYRPKKRTNWSQIFIIGLMGLALISFILTSIPGGGMMPSAPAAPPPPPPTTPAQTNELIEPASPPQFIDDGDLAIYRDGQEEPLTTIDVEFAVDEASIRQGLMWRRTMEPDQGMLFLMPGEEPRAFWMKNTYIPLDIIYANRDKRIVKIRPNTEPLSEAQVTSEAPAAYVLEVNAGFAAKHGLQEGDVLDWQ